MHRQLGDGAVAPDCRHRHLRLERRAVLLPCPLHVLLPRYPRFLGAGLHLSHLSHFRGPAQRAASRKWAWTLDTEATGDLRCPRDNPLTKPSSCEACSAFTRVAACTLALSPIRDTLIEGFSHFVTSMTAPIASGWSESPGGACTHWKAPPCHGAPPTRSLPRACRRDSVTRRRHRLIAFAPTAAAVRRRRPRIEVGDGDVAWDH